MDADHADMQRWGPAVHVGLYADAESFFATLKRELTGDRPWPSRTDARSAIFEWIEGWYNIRRLHSSLGYRTPADYESALAT